MHSLPFPGTHWSEQLWLALGYMWKFRALGGVGGGILEY